MTRMLPLVLAAAALLAPAAAPAAPAAPDPAARELTALGGTLVWISGEPGDQALMRRAPDGAVAPVPGSGAAHSYRSPDLGRDARGRLVLTYARCETAAYKCPYVRDDLKGDRAVLRGLALKQCEVSSTPAIWGERIAYGLRCFRAKNGQRLTDFERTGLYVKRGSRRPRMLPTPRNAERNGAIEVTDTDLRGARVGALYRDYDQFAVIQTVGGRRRWSVEAATTEDDLNNTAAGVVVGTGAVRLWYLVRMPGMDAPSRTHVYRMTGGCEEYEAFVSQRETTDRNADVPYTDLAVDGSRLYLLEQGAGIVEHAFRRTGRWC